MSTFAEAFSEAEENAMRFLVVRLGFRFVCRRIVDDASVGTHGTVLYESQPGGAHPTPPGWSVTLGCAPYRLELLLEISSGDGNHFSMEELHALEGTGPFPDRLHPLYPAALNAALQQAEFERLAGVLRASGRRFFGGDRTLWTDLAARRTRAAREANDLRLVAESESAFRAKDWDRVVDLLAPIAHRLGKAAAARLAYAQKMGGRPR